VGERGPARAKCFHLVQVRPTYPNPSAWPRRDRGGAAPSACVVRQPALAPLTGGMCAQRGGMERCTRACSCSADDLPAPNALPKALTAKARRRRH